MFLPILTVMVFQNFLLVLKKMVLVRSTSVPWETH